MNERNFKSGKFVSSKNMKKIRGGTISIERKLAISDPKYIDRYDFDNKNSFVLEDQMKTLTRPIACGATIFGISKAYMVSMWYKLIDKFGDENLHLIFTDTDSLAFELKGKHYTKKQTYLHHIQK